MPAIYCAQFACEDGAERARLVKLLEKNGYSAKGKNAKITAAASDDPLLDQIDAIEQILEESELDSYDKLDAIKEMLNSQNPQAILNEIKVEADAARSNRQARRAETDTEVVTA